MDAAVGTSVPAAVRPPNPMERDAAGSRRTDWRALLAILVVTALTRLGQFGDPIAHIDDQFYLYVGHSILAGDLPYVDIWDRKPIGLYLIYAACAAMGGNGVIAYQSVAGLFVVATGWCIFRLALLITGRQGSLFAALLYPVLIVPIGGGAGQAPVFYNLLIAGAALLTVKAVRDPGTVARGPAAAAMLLCGLALTIKPTTMFEGMAFGILLLWAAHRGGDRPERVARFGLGLVAVAIAPTAAAYLYYAALGHAGDMWQATVASVFGKSTTSAVDRLTFSLLLATTLLVPLAAAGASLAMRVKERGWDPANIFLANWFAAALLGFLVIPNFFHHYALPLAVPACVLMAPLLDRRPAGTVVFAIAAALFAVLGSRMPYFLSSHHEYDALVSDVGQGRQKGCLYVHYGPVQLYTDAGICRVTRFVFPDHLETAIEATALPVRAEEEMERIFAGSRPPAFVVTGPRSYLRRNLASQAVLQRQLSRGYCPGRWYELENGLRVQLWVRKSRPGAGCGARDEYNRS